MRDGFYSAKQRHCLNWRGRRIMCLEFIWIPYVLGRKLKTMQCPLVPCGARGAIIRFSKLERGCCHYLALLYTWNYLFKSFSSLQSASLVALQCCSSQWAFWVPQGAGSPLHISTATRTCCHLFCHPQPQAGCHMPPKYLSSGYFLAQPAWSSALVQGLCSVSELMTRSGCSSFPQLWFW